VLFPLSERFDELFYSSRAMAFQRRNRASIFAHCG
jgi:hypothetical protein